MNDYCVNCYNFCAITCQSCKAFFRRHAFKYEKYKCRYNNHCVIDVLNRRLCRRCRLSKCFAVGMNKEWILTAEEKEFRRQQVEENRKYRESKRRLKDMDSMAEIHKSSEISNTDTNSCNNDIKSPVDLNSDTNTADTDFGSPDTSNAETNESSVCELTADEIRDYIMEIENFIGDETIGQMDNSIAQRTNSRRHTTQELVPITATVPIPIDDYKNLNNIEFNRLKELINTSIFTPEFESYRKTRSTYPDDNPLPKFNSVMDLVHMAGQGFDSFIETYIHHTKRLTAFSSICPDDQMTMVKYSSPEASLLNGVYYYNYNSECWLMKRGNETSVMPLDLYKEFSVEMHDLFKQVLLKVIDAIDGDHLIMNMLVPLLLFNADRPYISHKETVIFQHKLYAYLLQRYLYVKYGTESNVKYGQVLAILHDITLVMEMYKKAIKHMSQNSPLLGPLLKEILDIEHDTCSRGKSYSRLQD
ncbi:unnamed protein product [Medioppia subpectinata]|uniref:Uncharacterized protein n=1 Tax=Medioppia subpectinata TaxID=1979941 RepID=A0A7R9KME2_9ACAR|nr:unnamed protein product [Medioppia subpectinata]CAG2105056.1 unnamed protein product [Medioppia subpectinata]